MNDKRIEKTIPVIALLLSLALTACGTQDFQPLTRVEQTAPAVFCKYKLPKNAEALPKSCSGKFLKVA